MTVQPKRALITGITGQDGSFLAELLLEKGYEVVGVVRGEAGGGREGGGERDLGCSEHLRTLKGAGGRLSVLEGDLLDADSLVAAVARTRPDELYHLASPSFIPDTWRRPAEAMQAIVGATGTLLEAVREDSPDTRVWLASSGAIFGDAGESPQRESTPCRPTTPYGVAKLAAQQLAGAMRAHDGLYACSGIVFNHESERRPHQFVTRTITRAAAKIKLGLAEEVTLGSLDAVRDWSFAGDTMRGAWLMLQQERPEDYVLASGVGRTVAELADIAFACVDLEAERYIRIDPKLVRAPERTPSVGDPTRARTQLGWEPELSFEQLVRRMVEFDLRELQAVPGPA
ncbi:MAG: GDP-mannose 4,6-dehydratase [Solirubrobacteraceae bacterium]